MVTSAFQFVLVLRSADGRALVQRKIEPDWEAAVEWARFTAWRKSGWARPASADEAVVEPVSHRTRPAPFADGFRVTVRGEDRTLTACSFPLTYFQAPARALATELVEQGQLAAGAEFSYLLKAFARPPAKAALGAPSYEVTDASAPPPLQSADFGALTAQATAFGAHTAGDIPIFMPQHILEETAELTTQARGVETGGILIGHLCRDEAMPELGVRVTAQIPVRHAESDARKLTFTAATWAAVHAALTLRCRDEVFVGWWHSHPSKYWCSPKCPPDRRRTCPFAQSFFSEDDVNLHQNVFAAAFHTALVVTNADDGLKHALFGWREGSVKARGFHVQPNARPLLAMPASHNLEVIHAPPCR